MIITYNDYKYTKKPTMRKYDSIKQIDLIDHEATIQAQPKYPQSCIQSSHRYSQKNISMSMQKNQHLQCITDRSRTDKIHQFSIGQSLDVTQTNSISTCVKSNIRTFIRFKPFTKQQVIEENCQAEDNGINIISQNKVAIQQGSCYSFDRVFQLQASQKLIYDISAKELVKSFINGYNGTIFAYGQTGSGKTYTMFGEDNLGIIPQSIQDIFKWIQIQKLSLNKVSLSCSMYEIYKQIICDLMTDKPKEIKIKQSANGNIQIQNLTVKQIVKKDELLEWINKGCQIRKTRQTQSNQRSSRSHLIFTLYLVVKINQFQSKISKLNLVDLAGSQKVSKTKVTGQGLQEAKKINLSLSCLGNAIYALSRGQQHIPFRDSKLTRVLQESLSGNSITRVIVTCSMLPSCKQQTISSLKFANRIKNIKTSGSINLKKINGQGVNKFMYQTLKACYQNCEQKLEKIKGILDSSTNINSKQEIIDYLKTVLTQGKYSSQNQFLNIQTQTPFQTFRSPSKQEISIQLNDRINNQTNCSLDLKNETKIPTTKQLLQHIKNLQTIIIKQEQTIQSQSAQIQLLSKNKQQKYAKKDITQSQQQQRRPHKIKIIKTNTNISNVGYKLKLVINNNKECDKAHSKQKFVYKTKYDSSNIKINEETQNNAEATRCTQAKNKSQNNEAVCGQIKQKISYDNMQKQILLKQIQNLCKENNYLRQARNVNANQQETHLLTQISNRKNTQMSNQQDEIIKKLEQKDAYIAELQKIISSTLPNQSLLPSKKNSFSFKNSLDVRLQSNRKRNIQLFVSPTASNTLNRTSSVKRLFRV